MNTDEILKWADEEVEKIECQTYEIADSGDYDSIYECTTYSGEKGFGKSFILAIEDAKKSENDPTKWDYIPPEHRTTPLT